MPVCGGWKPPSLPRRYPARSDACPVGVNGGTSPCRCGPITPATGLLLPVVEEVPDPAGDLVRPELEAEHVEVGELLVPRLRREELPRLGGDSPQVVLRVQHEQRLANVSQSIGQRVGEDRAVRDP